VANPADQWAPAASRVRAVIGGRMLITTEEVLTEFLAFTSRLGSASRQSGTALVRTLMQSDNVTLIEQSHDSWLNGLAMYEARPDKGYSLVDCISMLTMRRLGISEALTADRHFEQEGFVALLRDPSPRP